MSTGLVSGSRVAVVGSGISGIVAAYLLDKCQRYQVTLLEADRRLGGHTSTVVVDRGDDKGLAVDTGFIVLNDQTYPLFTRFLEELKVPVRTSDMSFSFEDRASEFAFAGTTLNGLFAQRSNLCSPRFYRLLREIARFGTEGRHFLGSSDVVSSLTLGQFIERGKYSDFMRDTYLLPISAAIWSAPLSTILDFPVRSFLKFFANHGLLSFRNRPTWQTVVGGSHEYLKAFERVFGGTVRRNSKVEQVEFRAPYHTVHTANGEELEFDAVVIATHADQAMRMLKNPTEDERALLSKWRYQRNHVVLHTDLNLLPRNRRAWASWNYIKGSGCASENAVSVTYHMNRLQGIKSKQEYCVTLNPFEAVAEDQVIADFVYEHPVYDTASVNTQDLLTRLQGINGRYFCGSYFGYGFHEDGVRSACAVAKLFGAEL